MKEFRTCPSCGYGRGFHVYFRADGERHRIGLICPGCGQSYDIGWVTGEVGGAGPEAGPVYDSREARPPGR